MIFCGYGLLFLTFAFYFYITNNYKFAFVFLGGCVGIISFYLLKLQNGYLIYVAVILSSITAFGIYDKLLTNKLNAIPTINDCGYINQIHITQKRGEVSTAQFIGKNNLAPLNYQELKQFVNIENNAPICVEYHYVKGWLRAGRVYQANINN